MKKIYGVFYKKEFLRVYNDDWDAWQFAYYSQDDEFRAKYWKQVRASRTAMRKLGWNVAEGRFVKC